MIFRLCGGACCACSFAATASMSSSSVVIAAVAVVPFGRRRVVHYQFFSPDDTQSNGSSVLWFLGHGEIDSAIHDGSCRMDSGWLSSMVLVIVVDLQANRHRLISHDMTLLAMLEVLNAVQVHCQSLLQSTSKYYANSTRQLPGKLQQTLSTVLYY